MQNDMRDRLVELIQDSVGGCARHWAEIIADNLIANGVIVPPCKVGSNVYKIINDKRVKKPYECKVIGLWYSADETCNNIHLAHYVNGVFESSFSIPFTEVGKIVFLTKEQAERKLKERKNNAT